MNKLFVLALAVLLVVVAIQARPGKESCALKCFKETSEKKEAEVFKACLKECLSVKRSGAAVFKPKREVGAQVESDDPIYPEEEDERVLSDSFAPKSGATLQATTGVNIRSGPCTDKSIVRTARAGETMKFTGHVSTACGYTWYGVTGGYAASNYLKEVSGPAPSPSGSGCRTRSYPLYKQCDGRWGSNSLGSRNVCAIGCLMSSVSMALNGLGKKLSNGQSPNPGTLNAWLKSNGGYQGNLFIWGAVARYGLKYEGQPTSSTQIKAAICANKVVILNVNNGGHWVLATGYNGDTYTVNDPGYSRSSYTVREVVRAGVYAL